MKTKVCSVCGEEKDINQFYKSNSNKDGRRGYCKDCGIAATIQYKLAANPTDAEKKYMTVSATARDAGADLCFTKDEFIQWYCDTDNLCCVTGMTNEESLSLRIDLANSPDMGAFTGSVRRKLGGRSLNTQLLSVARNDSFVDYTLDNLRKVDIIISAYKPKTLTLEEFSECGKLIIEKIRGELYGQE